MTITIEGVLDALNSDEETQRNQLLNMVLEAIAISKDNTIMNDLMVDMLQKNASMNKQMATQLEEIKRLSITDTLTGLYNRRKFIEELEKEMNRRKRFKNTFSIIMFDIDHFKHVNDSYGHDIGDIILQELSVLVGDRLRTVDTFTRWGGEEFMILVSGSGKKNTLAVAEDIRHRIENNVFTVVPGITCSFGVYACDHGDEVDIDDIIKQVDLALYEAKENGRNCVVLSK